MEEKNQNKNPQEYGYKGNEEITINGFQFRETLKIVNELLFNEIKEYYPEPKKWVNSKGEDASKKEIKEGNATEVLDVEAIFQNVEPSIMYTAKGLKLLRIKFLLEEVHHNNIERGISKHITELREEFEKPKFEVNKESKMEVVKE